MSTLLKTLLIGVGATLSMDIWSFILKQFKISSLDYRLLGRWILKMFEGQFFHNKIFNTPPVKNELLIGWVFHYLIGISFAFLLLSIYGKNWLDKPTLIPALVIGIGTIVAPFFLMQPAFGFGIAASNLPDPNIIRFKSFLAHLIYGIGLYAAAYVIKEMS
ncbi:MAG: DUF2938 domain-containing protein [Chitinophagales bacterium]|nr:DUF2938 domain-containing protein [Chitinophagales bacterium]